MKIFLFCLLDGGLVQAPPSERRMDDRQIRMEERNRGGGMNERKRGGGMDGRGGRQMEERGGGRFSRKG